MTKQVHAPGVLVSHELGADCFTGTAQDLVAAGLVRMEQLPGQPGGPKYAATYYAGVRRQTKEFTPKDENYLHILRPASGSKIRVTVGLSDSERRRREAIRDAQADKERVDRASAAFDIAPGSQKDYRQTGKRLSWMLWRLASSEQRGEDWSLFDWELEADAAAKMNDLLRQVWDLFDQAEVAELDPHRAAFRRARADTTFQDFLKQQCLRAPS
jgi:hypothetical protein